MPGLTARLLIAFLLVLAIPAQGLAAASGGICMAMGHHGFMGDAPAAHDHDDGHDHGAAHSSPDSHKQESKDGHAGKAHCPPCASCCAAAVISPAVHLTLPEESPSQAFPGGQSSITGFLPDELDRPPLPL